MLQPRLLRCSLIGTCQTENVHLASTHASYHQLNTGGRGSRHVWPRYNGLGCEIYGILSRLLHTSHLRTVLPGCPGPVICRDVGVQSRLEFT